MSTDPCSRQISWLYNGKVVFKLETIFFLITKQGIQRMRNIALVHPELNLFISKKSGVSQALLLRNVDKISHLSLSIFL